MEGRSCRSAVRRRKDKGLRPALRAPLPRRPGRGAWEVFQDMKGNTDERRIHMQRADCRWQSGGHPDPRAFLDRLLPCHVQLRGVEEGGWWFTEGELVTDPDTYRALGGTPSSFLTEDNARAYAATLEANLPPLNSGRPPKHASTSQGVFEIHVLQAASLPPGFPPARPHYE